VTELRKRLAAEEDTIQRRLAEQAVRDKKRSVAEAAAERAAVAMREALASAETLKPTPPGNEAGQDNEAGRTVPGAMSLPSSGTGSRKKAGGGPRSFQNWVLVRGVNREMFNDNKEAWREEVVRVTGEPNHANTYMQVAGNKELRIVVNSMEACEKMAREGLEIAGRRYRVVKLKI